jgi:hypothetical protein
MKGLSDELYPFEIQPNVATFKITALEQHHPVLAAEGIEMRKKFGPKMEFTKGKNKKLNRYLNYMFRVLNNQRHNPKLFWKID